jgi:hypothetical protein
MTVDKIWELNALTAVLARGQALFGGDLDRLMRKYTAGRSSKTRPKYEHRLVGQIQLLQRAVDEPSNAVVQSAASVVIAEVDGTLQAFEDWAADQAWPEFRRAILDPRECTHASTTLMVASALKEHHKDVALVAAPKVGRAADLSVVVTDEYELAVEVKTSPKFRGDILLDSDAVDVISHALSEAGTSVGGQLGPDRPAILVVGGTQIDAVSFERLERACTYWLQRPIRTPDHLLGIVISRIFFKVGVVDSRVQVILSHESRIRRNPRYSGSLRLHGDWANDWRLVPTDQEHAGAV